MCKNLSTDSECQYLTQETSCIGPAPFKCQCLPGKYFNNKNYKCETLLEFSQSCLQTDFCRNAFCIGLPSKCDYLQFQYFDPISNQCQNQNESNNTVSSSTVTSKTSTFTNVSSPTLTSDVSTATFQSCNSSFAAFHGKRRFPDFY